MKILIYSPAFLPMVGGLENMAYMLAKEWSLMGNEITVVTNALRGDFEDDQESFTILRNPSIRKYWSTFINNDVIFFLNISLKGIWPWFLKTKLVFVSHQITYYSYDGRINLLEQIKRQLSRLFVNISCSEFVKSTLPKKRGFVIHNAYDSEIFYDLIPFDNRIKDVIFVGRLVSDKGVDTLIRALGIISSQNQKIINLEIVGEGPELKSLEKLILSLGIEKQIKFLGKLTGKALAKKINEHQLMVVPSKWKEPFGLVALEGLACGCKMVVSKNGGLQEATGSMAEVFENDSKLSLASAILAAVKNPQHRKEDIDFHLKQHTPQYIAEKYLSIIKEFDRELSYV